MKPSAQLPALGVPTGRDGFGKLLGLLGKQRRFPAMSLREAIRSLVLLDDAALDALQREDPRLLADHCADLVTRKLLSRDALGHALARMAGLPGVDAIDLQVAPPAFANLLLRAPPPPSGPPRPACTLTGLIASLDQRRVAVESLRESITALHLMDEDTLDACVQADPSMLRGNSQQLVTRVLLAPDELGRALARVAGLPEIDALAFELGADAFERLPMRLARGREVLPLGLTQDSFFVASGTPTNEELRRYLCAMTGCNVIMVWASDVDILARLEREERAQGGHGTLPDMQWADVLAPAGTRQRARDHAVPALLQPPPGRMTDPAQDLPLEDLVTRAVAEVEASAGKAQDPGESDVSGMARMVARMIRDAQAAGASDIHVESAPGDANTVVRMRRDGDLEPWLLLPARLRAAIVSRIKIMAKLDISERRRPQDGKINFADFGGGKLELRVAIMPTHDGLENVVLRLLASSRPMPLSRLGLQPRDEETITRLSAHTWGLVLAAGPTGSGKTTTLHSMLARMNTQERKIWTAEDPIEITQPGLSQVQVNPKIGLTFAAAMRGFLRADPDVIMIGEIRDEETARIAIEASLTGHLVLSTLHTNSASESVVRLLDLGMDPMNFADSLLGVVAQRLVRALCRECAQPQVLDAQRFAELVGEYVATTRLGADVAATRLLQAAGVQGPGEVRLWQKVGCVHCNGKGYKSRMGVYEILENSASLRALIQQRARPSELFDAAIAAGMRCLRHDALEKVVQGLLDLPQARAAYF
jgi:type II secretory ATPase GspE/PulE/Tfp pilus assembly ATPase PilB-like protein